MNNIALFLGIGNGAMRRGRQRGAVRLFAVLIVVGVMLAGFPPRIAQSASYSYSVAPAGPVNPGWDDGVIPDNQCGETGFWNVRYFVVNERFNVTDLNVRFTATHASRGHIRVTLTSPADASGATVNAVIVPTSSDTNDNYDILLDADAAGNLNDGNADTVANPVDRNVNQTLLNGFEGRDAHGAWRMDICDNVSGDTGHLVGATLFFTGDPITPPTPQFTQGPPALETYYIPWPESELWTAMDTIFNNCRAACAGDTTDTATCVCDGATWNSSPRQPIINYTGIVLSQANTIIYYDHFEDGYEPMIAYPVQATTEVWGDGNLTNGRAPADADDVLASGQILILNDVKDSTAAEVVDYDSRDKLASTAALAVSRSAWANGSVTLFATAEEVYPTSMWGDDYLLPVGENIDNTLHDYYQYTGVSVMAAADGTVVHIDKNDDGTDEMTCNLNQGQSCQWDDSSATPINNVIGNGLNVGSRIHTDDGKPIQVNLLTGDVCANFETRSFPLLPVELWSDQYYAPVSSSTVPSIVTLYNPGDSPITVYWTFGTGATGSQTVGANQTYDVSMPNGTGARFYSVVSGVSYTYRDDFNSQAYNNSDGTKVWTSTPWVEIDNGGNGWTGGNVWVEGGTSDRLRFEMNVAGVVGNQITRPVDLSTATSATLSVYFDGNSALDSDDDIEIRVTGDGWTTYRVLDTLDGDDADGQRDYTLNASEMTANTQIGFFVVTNSTSTTSESSRFNWVEISYQEAGGTAPVFNAIGLVDTNSTGDYAAMTYDWGYTLVPVTAMSQYLVVGWAPGHDPNIPTATQNSAPVWLTGGHTTNPASTTAFQVCVDYNGNGGPTTDPITGRTYDTTVSVTPFGQTILYDPDGEQTGMQLWVCDVTSGTDAVITAAWGEDPDTATVARPAMDMGYTIRNQSNLPTSVKLLWFEAIGEAEAIRVSWETASEVDLLGFNVYRAEAESGPRIKLNVDLIPVQSPGHSLGGIYEYLDAVLAGGIPYFYWLETVDMLGARFEYGPVTATVEPKRTYGLYLPVVSG